METTEIEQTADDLLPEYDFTGKKGVRGKYYRAYRQGHSVRIHKEDGSVAVQHSAADLFREIGPWEGESTEELWKRLDDERRRGKV